jgi:hypothetical protein
LKGRRHKSTAHLSQQSRSTTEIRANEDADEKVEDADDEMEAKTYASDAWNMIDLLNFTLFSIIIVSHLFHYRL